MQLIGNVVLPYPMYIVPSGHVISSAIKLMVASLCALVESLRKYVRTQLWVVLPSHLKPHPPVPISYIGTEPGFRAFQSAQEE